MTNNQPNLILASGSPRRRDLLAEAGYYFDVNVPGASAEGGVRSDKGPAEYVTEMALRKATDVVLRIARGIVVACDTVAECQGQILGKPANKERAREMLLILSGREHRVYSGLCVWQVPEGKPDVRVARTTLRMDLLSNHQLDAYVETHAWQGKAGGFGFQDGLDWVHLVEGSESNVVGLPMELLAEMLVEVGRRVDHG